MKKKECCKGCDGFQGCEFACAKYKGVYEQIQEDLKQNEIARLQRLQKKLKKRKCRAKTQKEFEIDDGGEQEEKGALSHTKACKNCLKWIPIHRKGDFCSDKCKKDYDRRHGKTVPYRTITTKKQCPGCGHTFVPTGNNQRFCTEECRADYYERKGLEERTCDICGKRFMQMNKKQRTCHDPACKKERARRYAREHTAEKRGKEQ